jgi:Zn-dependent M28 family amino/carboxypeptidase
LALAEYYARNKPKYSIAFIAFAAEEAGLVGSFHFTANPLIPLENILFVLNTDLAGTGDDGITVVNATAFEPLYQRMDSINRARNLLPQVVRRAQTANSDHYPFSLKGVPAFFIYTRGGIAAYHDVFDKPETLPLTKFKELFTLLCLFLESEPKAPKR